MSKVAIVTDSNSGIRQEEGKKLGIYVLPMPFTINGETFYEDINLTHSEFFDKLMSGAEVFTSQPLVGDVSKLWDDVLKEYDEIVYIPMSSGLSGSCQTAIMLANEYDGKVPDDFNKLLKLPGVGRKSANLIMGDVFGKPAIVTDTH